MSKPQWVALAVLFSLDSFAARDIAQWVYESTSSIDLAYVTQSVWFLVCAIGLAWCLYNLFHGNGRR